ncbi:MAG: T9SS type A sorting domain-containing protein [Bacteroidia bacterium]|nr:T9SS type A sorting domain-containing protein [Bacteroidia bacterium]
MEVLPQTTLTVSNSGIRTFATTPTVNGVLSIEGTATINVTSGVVTYGANATLQYNTSVARTASSEEWISTFAATGGIIITNTGAINMDAVKVFNSTAPLTINNGSALTLSTYLLTLNGDLINNGGTISGSGGVTLAGTSTQSIGSFTTTGALSVSKTSGTATLMGNVNAASLAFNTSTNGSTILALNSSGVTLTISGGITINQPSANNTSNTLQVGAGNVTCSTISLLGTTGTACNSNLNISTGTVTVSGDITSSGVCSRIIFSDAGNFMGGSAGTFTASTSTVVFNLTGAQTVAPFAYTFNNVTLTGSGAKTTTNATINGILSMEGTATTTGIVPTYGSNATLQYKGSAAQTTGIEFPATWSGAGGVIIANTSGYAVTLGAAKVVNAPLIINNGAIFNTSAANNYALTFGDDFINNGTFTANGSAITIANTKIVQSIAGFTTTGTVQMTKTSGTATLQGATSGGVLTLNGISGTLNLGVGFTHNVNGIIFTNGILNLGTCTINIAGAVALTTGTLNLSSGTMNLTGNFTGTGTLIGGTGTINFNGTSAQTAVGNTGYYIVKINNAVGVTLTGAATLYTLTIGDVTSGSIFNDGGFQLTSTGNFNLTSGIFNLGTTTTATTFPAFTVINYGTGSTVAFISGVAQTVAAATYPNLSFSGAGTKTTATGTLTAVGNWIISGGVANLAVNNSNITVTGNITFTSGITSGTGTIMLGGNWTNTGGTFTVGTGTVTFNGTAAEVITGTPVTQTFYNVIIYKTAGTLLSVTGSTTTLTVNKLTETSGDFNAPLTLNISGTLTLTSGTFTAGQNIYIGGDWTNNGGIFNYGFGTVTFNGTLSQAINGIATSQSFDNVIIAKTAGTMLSVSGNTSTLSVYNLTQTTGNFTAPATLRINGNVVLTSGIFSAGTSVICLGNWTNNGTTVNPGTSTVTFNGTGSQTINGTATSQIFYNLILNKNSGTFICTSGSTISVTMNDLTLIKGTFQVNDATNVKRTINVNGDVLVESNGNITTGTGNPNTGGYTLPSNLPPVGQYHSIFHELIIRGNFTNYGNVNFSNLTAPNYGAFTTTGSVTVRLIGPTDNTIDLNGPTNFYNLVIDKGTDKTFIVTLISSDIAYFALYGPTLLGRVEASPFTSDNPEIRKSLWIKNGTLKFTGELMIPTLTESDNNTGNGDYAIGSNSEMWIDGPDVTVYTTATDNTGFPQAPVGSSGVLATSGYQALSVYGTFRITEGFFGTRNSAGFIFWDTPNSTAIVLFEGGLTNTSIFREGESDGKAAYIQTGGTVIIRGNETEPGEVTDYPVFNIPNPATSFIMSGGVMIIEDKDNGTADGNGFYVNSSPENYSVTGGTVIFQTNPVNTPSIDINSTANFWDLEINNLTTTGNPVMNLMNNLKVSNDLTIYSIATLYSGTGNYNVTVGGNFYINAGGTYSPGTNTTIFTGTESDYLWNDGTITNGLYNLQINKTSGSVILGGSVTSFTIRNDLTIGNASLADGGKVIYVNGNIYNNGTILGPGRISLNNSTTSQTITGDGSGSFQNIELNNTSGSSGSATVYCTADIQVTGNLSLTNDRIFDISDNLLSLTSTAAFLGTFSNQRFIRTAGYPTNKGVMRIFSDTIAFTYPLGTGTNYTPVTLHVNSAPVGYGSVAVIPVPAKHPLATNTTCLAYYWKLIDSDFSGIVPGSIQMIFNYGNLPDNTSYVPGKYSALAWSYINDVTLVDESAKEIRFNTASSISGDYTAGIPAAFAAITSYYSRTNGAWDTPATWSNTGFGGPAATTIPGASNIVYIGDGATYNHTVTVPNGTALCGNLTLSNGSVLDLGTSTGNNFGTVISGSNGTLRISANTGTAVFPAGDFSDFLGSGGGIVEYYTTGSQDFTIPAVTASPSSMNIAGYHYLKLIPASGRSITMPNSNLEIYSDMTVQGASSTALARLNSSNARSLTIDNNLYVNGGNLLFQNGTVQTLIINNDLTISSGAIFNVANSGIAVNNSLSIGGDLTNNGTFDMSVGSSRLCNVTFTGSNNAFISGTGSTTDFYSITLDKGNSATNILNITSSAFTFSNNTTPLILINGTFRLTSSLSVTVSAVSISIPASTCLSANGGTIVIATTASDNADVDLSGKIEIISGAVTVGNSANNNNNDIVYAGAGSPTLDLQGGTLFVNGQIRRSTDDGMGSLIYKQSGNSAVTINGRNSQSSRAKLEILNLGSEFDMSGTSTLTIVRGAGVTFYDLYISPTNSTVTGGTIIFGNASTENTNQANIFTIGTLVPLNNLTIDGTTYPKTVTLSNHFLYLYGNLTINSTSIFKANNFDVTINGNFTNLNTDANTGISTGGYQAGSLMQTTTFSGSSSNQSITGTSGNLTNFANLVIDNTFSAGTVTLQTNSNLRANSSLTLSQGILADGGNVITVIGNIENSATHSGSGHITLAGSGIQVLSGDGTGKFSNMYLNSNYDVQMTASMEYTGTLTFNSKMLYIGGNLLNLSSTSSGSTAGYSSTSYIICDGLTDDAGVQKSYPASALDYTFPIGVAGKYTPARINVTANSAAGTAKVVPVNTKHPATTNPFDKQLLYYWTVVKTGFSGLQVNHVYTYVPSDVTGIENYYDAARFYNNSWDYGPSTSVNPATHTANFTSVNYIDGDFTAGESSEFNAIYTFYSRNATSGGNWNDVNTWSTTSHSGDPATTYPNGQPVDIAAGHTVHANGTGRYAYSVVLNGTLDLASYISHSLGNVSGTGTIKMNPFTSGDFIFPSGNFSIFNNTGGGTVELNNSSGTAAIPYVLTYNNLSLTGAGTKQMIEANIRVKGDLTNGNGSTFITSDYFTLILEGNLIDNGTFVQNNGTTEFNGNTTMSGVSGTTFHDIVINPDMILTGKSSASFSITGNWNNNGIFNHNSGTVIFNGNTTISGSEITTFNNISITQGSILTGYFGNIIMTGNWVNNGIFEHNYLGTMNIFLNFIDNGTFTHNLGTVVFNGYTQTIGGSAHSDFNNMVIDDFSNTTISTAGQTLMGILLCNGTLNANSNLTLLSASDQTALIDGSGTGQVYGDVTMQRYLPSGFGYKYCSSPFQDAIVNEFSDEMNLYADFPTFYRYDENRPYTGWVVYTNPSNPLVPMAGYAVNFGPSDSPLTIDIIGIVNNGALQSPALFNHNRTYTMGFNLIGNPYPSPVDWNASQGWIRQNIDNALYYFNAGTTNQYTGSYSSYINGVSSDGIANNIIPAMQGFFVHVSNGNFPVSATLIFNNTVRINNLSPHYHKSAKDDTRPLLRFSAAYTDYSNLTDPLVVYFNDSATLGFDNKLDALKLMNTDNKLPNVFTVISDTCFLSINSIPIPADTFTVIPVGLKTIYDGEIIFNAQDFNNIPDDMYIYLSDNQTKQFHRIQKNQSVIKNIIAGTDLHRFALIFSLHELNYRPVSGELFYAYESGGKIFVYLNLEQGERGLLSIYNLLGQIVYKEELTGNGYHEIQPGFISGIYIVSLTSGKNVYARKVLINNQ